MHVLVVGEKAVVGYGVWVFSDECSPHRNNVRSSFRSSDPAETIPEIHSTVLVCRLCQRLYLTR